VDAAVKKGLPKTAITNLDLIITAAMKDKAHAEAVKAIGQKIALEATSRAINRRENHPDAGEIEKAPGTWRR